MTATSNLPFELNADALASWIDALSALPQIQAAHQLNQALKQLKDAECQPADLLPLLISLTPLALHYSNSITAVASAETKPSDKSRKLAKLGMQLLRQLSLLFCQLVEHNSLTASEQQSAIYHGLQSIGYCIRCYSLFYEAPSATLWKKSAFLYGLAAKQDYLHLSQPIKLAEFKQQASIEDVIKRNLLFNILAPTLFTPNEINQLFQLANQYAPQLMISTTPANTDFGFYWDLNDDIPPCSTRKSKRALPLGFLAIDSQAVGLALQQNHCFANLDRHTQTGLAVKLTNYQPVFDSIVPGQTTRSEFLFGFNDVAAFLNGLNKLQKIKQLSGKLNDSTQSKRNLALIPMEHEKNAFETMSQALAEHNTISKTGNVLRISHGKYLVAEGNAFGCSSGDIAMYYRDLEPATLAIIRTQSALSISNVTHILMEKITGFYSIYSFKSGKDTHHAIVLDEDSDHPQVFLPPGKYNVDSKIQLTIDESLHLTACLESNNYFARFRFRFDS